jgi:transformation/transcription domain-associated protein
VVAWERQRQNEMRVVHEAEGVPGGALAAPMMVDPMGNPNPNANNPNLLRVGLEQRHIVRGTMQGSDAEDLSKRVKVEPGLQSFGAMSPGGPPSIPNVETPGGSAGQPDEEYKPNAAMEEMIITFLIRVCYPPNPKKIK